MLLKSFVLGTKFDLRFLALIHLFLLFTFSLFTPKALKYFSLGLFEIILLFYALHFGNYQYLQSPIDATMLNFLQNPYESFLMIWQTYPVIWLTLALIILGIGHFILFSKLITASSDSSKSRMRFFFTFFLLGGLIYGKIDYYPLRWSESFFTPISFYSTVAMNPLIYFYHTLKYKEMEYEIKKVEESFPAIAQYLRIPEKNAKLNYTRFFAAKQPNKQPNIVVIVLESLAFEKTSMAQFALNPTPFLKDLSNKSWYFPNCYSPTEATARGLFTVLTGMPDMSQKDSSSRNPKLISQNVLMNQFKGYEKYYFLGGSASWGNIRGLFTKNIEGINLFEENRYTSPRVDVWGISDFDLFSEALSVFQKQDQQKPFVAIVQTSGFHRPYSIPANLPLFKSIHASKKDLDESSFENLAEFNAMRLQDYSLEHFITEFSKLKSFENTLFIMLGDHGLANRNPLLRNSGINEYGLFINHIPLLIYSPKLIPPKVDRRSVSQVDVFATAADLAGIEHNNTTLGKSVVSKDFAEKSYAFTYNWQNKKTEYKLIYNDLLYHYLDGQEGLYSFKGPDYKADQKNKNIELFEEMKKVAAGFYHSARYIRYHNKPQTLNLNIKQ